MAAVPGALRGAAGGALGPVERRLLGQAAVRRSLAVSVGIGLVAAATIPVQAVVLAGLLAAAMGARDPIPSPRSSGWAGRRWCAASAPSPESSPRAGAPRP